MQTLPGGNRAPSAQGLPAELVLHTPLCNFGKGFWSFKYHFMLHLLQEALLAFSLSLPLINRLNQPFSELPLHLLNICVIVFIILYQSESVYISASYIKSHCPWGQAPSPSHLCITHCEKGAKHLVGPLVGRLPAD